MSVSTYRSQVDRLSKDLAGLEAKLADARGRAAKERGDAMRKQSSITRSTSPSTARQRLRDAQRHEERAADADKKAARVTDQIAAKQRQLTSAQNSLERALKQERDKEERDNKRRRQDELRHLQEIEKRRRISLQPPPLLSGRQAFPAAPTEASTLPSERPAYEYDVCLSFAGEDRPYVEMVARLLKQNGIRVFYDQDETTTLWGKDLAEHLDHVYREASRFCVLFISEHYARKEWTRHERRSALARAIEEEDEYILPARFDDTELPGLRPTVGYIDLRQYAPASLVELLVEKLGRDESNAA